MALTKRLVLECDLFLIWHWHPKYCHNGQLEWVVKFGFGSSGSIVLRKASTQAESNNLIR